MLFVVYQDWAYQNSAGPINYHQRSRKIHEVFNKGLAKVNSPRALLTLGHDINPVELAGGKSTHTEALLEDGETPPLLTQPPSKYSPPLDSLDSPDSPLPHL